eukprot:3240452-Prymnesium_polylepis.1
MTSMPPMASGTELPCTGVGTEKPARRRLRASMRPQLSPAKSLTGRTASGNSVMPWGNSTSTGMSLYLAKSMPELAGGPNSRR